VRLVAIITAKVKVTRRDRKAKTEFVDFMLEMGYG
jgi:hypothetical protein